MREITCPSGLVGVVRDLKIREQKELTNQKTISQGGLTLALVDKLWTETLDAGFYPTGANGKPDWNIVLQGDITFIVMAIGVETHGPEYDFKASCSHCGKQNPWTVDVWDQLPVYDLPPDTLVALANGQTLFPAETRDGTGVQFRLLTGKDTSQLVKIRSDHKEEIVSRTAALRIKRVDGIDAKDHKGRKEWILDLSFGDLMFLQKQFEDVSCGVETEIEIMCSKCDREFDVDIDLGYDFLVRKRSCVGRKRKRKRARRVGSGRSLADQS